MYVPLDIFLFVVALCEPKIKKVSSGRIADAHDRFTLLSDA